MRPTRNAAGTLKTARHPFDNATPMFPHRMLCRRAVGVSTVKMSYLADDLKWTGMPQAERTERGYEEVVFIIESRSNSNHGPCG
jgi:hypothetical protein